MRQILEGIRILDWSQWAFGPVAAVLMGQMGADVIKLEKIQGGDRSRGIKRTFGGNVVLANNSTVHFECSNFNKRGIAIDYKTQEGREIIYRLVKQCDVFMHNYRIGAPEAMKLSYEDLKKHNPKLIYASANGFGTKGPEASLRSYNVTGLARSGLMYTVNGEGEDAEPRMIGVGMGDLAGALMFAYGILGALLARERFGIGQQLDTSHLAACLVLNQFGTALNSFTGFKYPGGDRLNTKVPLWNTYRCKDNTWVAFIHLDPDRHWSDFCHALGIENLEKDPRFMTMEPREANSRELIEIIDKVIATKAYAEWEKRFKECDLVYTKINRTSDLFEDPQVVLNEYIVDYEHPELGKVKQIGCPVKYSETPGVAVTRRAPTLGEHTDEILHDIGEYSWDEITEFRKKQIIL